MSHITVKSLSNAMPWSLYPGGKRLKVKGLNYINPMANLKSCVNYENTHNVRFGTGIPEIEWVSETGKWERTWKKGPVSWLS